MTAHRDDQERARCLKAGMKDFITKPISIEELSQLLARYESS